MAVQGKTPVTDYKGLAQIEFGVTPEQSKGVAQTCMGQAAKAMSPSDRTSLQSAITEMQAVIAQALDKIRSSRARIGAQKKNLQQEINALGSGTGNVGRFYSLAAGMVANCGSAATVATGVKQASDLVYANGNELRYRQSLLNTRDTSLSAMETALESTRDGLDQMSLALRQG